MKAEDDFEIQRLCSDHTLMQTTTSEDTICLCIQSKERRGQRLGENGHCQCQRGEKESNLATWVGERRLHCPGGSALSVWGRGGKVGDQSFLEYVSKTDFLQQRNLRRLITQIIALGMVWEWPVIVVIIIVNVIILLNLRQLVWEWLEGLGSGLVRDKPETWTDSAWPGGQNF